MLRTSWKNWRRSSAERGRDLEQLSCFVKDTTLLDGQSFLLNSHLQDAVDDQNEAIKKMEEKVKDGELKLKDKDETIGKLEDLLKAVESNRKDMENALLDSEDRLLKERTKADIRDKTIKGLHTVITAKAKEMEGLVEKVKARDEEIKKMQEEFQDAAELRQKELDRQHEEINLLEQKEATMKVRLAEQESELENLMRSLGRKEGELEGFKELLSKAQNALQQSEDAVEVLQDQLKKDRVPSNPSSAHSSPIKHYKDMLDESQKLVSEKDNTIHQLNDVLRDKDKQLRTCMGIFNTPQEVTSGEMMDKLTRQLKESDRALARALEEHATVVGEKEKKLEELRRVLSDKEEDITRANKMLITAEDTIDRLEKANKEKENNLRKARDGMKAAEKALEDAEQSYKHALAEKNSIIGRLQDSVGDKEALLKETMKRAPMTTDEVMDLKMTVQNKDRTIQDMIDEKDKTLTANAECVNSLLKKLQAREAEIGEMGDKHRKDISNMEQEMLKMAGDLRKLEMELRRKQNDLQSADSQASWSHQQSQDVLDKLRAVISDKDKTISTLLDSVQEKDKVTGQLRHDLQGKDGLVDKLQMLLRQSQTGSSADLNARLQELQIELAVKTEGLKNARRTEEDLREQIQELKQKFDSVPRGDREYHTLEKQIYWLKDKLEGQGWTPGGSSPEHHGSPGSSNTGSAGQQGLLQETLQAQLDELRVLNAAVKREQHLLEGIRDKSQGSDHSHAVDEELAAVRTLRRELEDGVQHNHQMRTILERQMKDIPTKESSQENIDDLKKTLNFLKLELETSKLNNKFLQSKNEQQTRQRVEGEGRADSYHQGAQTSPVTWSPGKKRSPSPIDANVQLNRQSLSDMSAPMLRKLIRQLQQQLSQEEKDNAELRRKLSTMDDVRNIPGKNDDDENSIPYLRSEIERLESELIRKGRVISELQVRLNSQEQDINTSGITDLKNEMKKLSLQLNHTQEVNSVLKQQLRLNEQSKGNDFDPEVMVQMVSEIQKLRIESDKARREGSMSSDTSEEPCSSVSTHSAVFGDNLLKGRSHKKGSQIPRPRSGNTPVVGDISAISQPETLKTLLMESKKRITNLEDKLKATEATVRYQTQKMKYYKGLLEDHGLINRSPMCSRSSSESNLAALSSKIPVRKWSVSQENLPSGVVSLDSAIGSDYAGVMDTVFEKFGTTDDKETLKDQVTTLRQLLIKQSRDIKSLRDRLEKESQRESGQQDQDAQTLHSLDDTLVSRDTLQNLHQQMDSLQRHLQETQDTNSELQHKLLQQQHNNPDSLKQQLQDSRANVAALEEKIAAFQNSSVHEILESQKSEISILKKRLSDTQNSCTQLNYWLEELSTFLTELVYVDQDGDRSQVRGMKHKVDMSKSIVRNMSTCILDSFDTSYDVTSEQPQTDENKGLVAENDALRKSEQSLTEGLRQKNLEVEKLTNELRKKNMLVDQLHQELLHFHQMNRKSESPKSSSTVSSADGNVNPSGKLSREIPPNKSPNRSHLSEQVSQVSSLRSPERMRHMTGSSLTDGSHLRLDRTQDGIVIVEDMADSSQGSTGYHSSRLSGDDFMPGPGHVHNVSGSDKENSSIYISAFDTDEKFMYNRRLADGQIFDDSMTPPVFKLNGDTSLPAKMSKISDGRQVELSILEKSAREDGEVESLRARLSAVEDLNKTLKDELNVYENLCTSIGVQNSPIKMSPQSKSKRDTDTDLLRQHLAEIRQLRIKLEHSVKDSDRLRHQLELDMDGHKITTDSTQNVYMYSKQQTTITELQQMIRQLQQQLKENQSTVRDKIITIQEREWTIQKLQQELSGIQQKLDCSTDIKMQTPEKDISIREWHEKIRNEEQTCIVQQRRIEQQDNLLEQLRKKLQLQEHSLHQQETKLKDMYESGQQKEQLMQDKDNIILRRGEQIVQLEQSVERTEKKISQLEDCVKKQEEQILKKESCLKTMKEELQKQEDTIQHHRDVVKQKENAIRKQKDEIQKKNDIIKQQGEVLAEKETAMQSLSHVVKEQADHMRHKDNTILKYDKKVHSLSERVKQMDQLKAEKDEANKRLVQRNEILDQDNCKLLERNNNLDMQLKDSSKEVNRLKQEIETMLEKAQENQDLNKTLKLELSVYEKLQAEDSSNKPLGGFDIRELLTEIRHLRVQLERCIDTNNALRQKLEEHLLHQASPRQVTTTTTNIFNVKDGSPTRSNGTDVPDGQPNPERTQVNGALTIRRIQSHQAPMGSRSASGSYVSNSSDSMSVSCPSDTPSLSGYGISTWPPMCSENALLNQQRELYISQSSPGGTLHQSLVDMTKLGCVSRPVMSDGNLSYYVDDPPSSVADLTGIKVDSDIRCLFAVGKLDDYEKLKKENCETLTVLKGIEARIKERLRVFKTMPTSELIKSVEYSTLKELSLSSENLRICLDEEKSLIGCFWTTQLPKAGSDTKAATENKVLRTELFALQSKYDLMVKMVKDAEARLHTSNKQKQSMEEIIHRQYEKLFDSLLTRRQNLKLPACEKDDESGSQGENKL
ncbi:golgin subfamily B member 1-like isoform X3 [Pecten maximus]|uniref:golgin subfamily B member 1-like isoform X3 n=1 Tax=Pecten maximus TaxID=6579 RepID=UPI001458973D|nr:golgin subfamily B member 1-like isoform X3 [Pecten maximus]